MRKTVKTIGIIGVMAISLCGSYLLGTTQVKEVTAIKEVEKIIEIVPNGYIDTTSAEFYNNYVDMRMVTGFSGTVDGLQLYFNDNTGYYWEQ